MNQAPPQSNSEWEGVGQGVRHVITTARVLFFLLRIFVVVVLVYMVFSGVFSLEDHEEGMLFRFGRLVTQNGREVLTSGAWYWAWPYPIDRVQKIPAQKSERLSSVQFWPQINVNQLQPNAPPQGDMQQGLAPGQGGYLLTGDANIMHSIWTVTYRITDAKKYYLRYLQENQREVLAADAEIEENHAQLTIRNLLENAVLKEVAGWSVEDVLVLSRLEDGQQQQQSLAKAVQARVSLMVQEVDLGVEIQQVSLTDIQPPTATQAAFNEVVDAATDYRTEIENARAYEERIITETEGQASKIMAEAEAYRTKTVESVKADNAYFEKVLEEYNKNPETMLVALYTDVLREVLEKVPRKYVLHSKADGEQELRLQLGPVPEKKKNQEAQE